MDMINAEYTLEWLVTEDKIAANVGSGDVNVFATPMMIALMEGAAVQCLKPFLEEGQTSVGASISTSHVAATPIGMKVSATAKIVAVDGKKIDLAVSAFDEAGIIGEGTHTRFIVDKERFEQRAATKMK
ncbi:thioesterase family protein [Hydrogenoanaerobacterium sp.]|uniref:thioesterase family protein n=1 Tax=Hydrogenoanaerobacterium sp. TaxID=2953763 RepID=UPI0028A033E8|nr:thioesterase family protein [Hydrogenoanaerobacterium sp.]